MKNLGYDVVTKGTSEIVENVPFVFLRPWETSIFAGLCGNVISIPTGIAHSIGILNDDDKMTLQVLLQKNDDAWRHHSGNWSEEILPQIRRRGIKGYFKVMVDEMMSDFKFLHCNNIKKIYVIADDSEDETIDKLISNLQ